MAGEFSPETREAIKFRAGYLCERCGANWGEEIHHRRPRGMGSSKRPATAGAANGVFLCGPCHRWIESNRNDARDDGWICPQHAEPSEWPLDRLGLGRPVLLDDAGNFEVV
jgi:hypothetical protein